MIQELKEEIKVLQSYLDTANDQVQVKNISVYIQKTLFGSYNVGLFKNHMTKVCVCVCFEGAWLILSYNDEGHIPVFFVCFFEDAQVIVVGEPNGVS